MFQLGLEALFLSAPFTWIDAGLPPPGVFTAPPLAGGDPGVPTDVPVRFGGAVPKRAIHVDRRGAAATQPCPADVSPDIRADAAAIDIVSPAAAEVHVVPGDAEEVTVRALIKVSPERGAAEVPCVERIHPTGNRERAGAGRHVSALEVSEIIHAVEQHRA